MKKITHISKNPKSTARETIIDQMNEMRPLPMGRKEFDEWARRIISGALIANEDGLRVYHDEDKATDEQKERLKIFEEGQYFALANMIMHLGPTESHKQDAFFIHTLRKVAINQVADAVRLEVRDKAKARDPEAFPKEESKGANPEGGISDPGDTVASPSHVA